MIAERWLAGASTAEFPVPPGTPMGGYVARTSPAAGTLDSLTISALWLQAGGQALVIVSADIVAVDAALTASVARAAKIPRDSLLLAASHTHSGPAGVCHKLHISNQDDIDQRLRRRFVETCKATIADARATAQSATVSIGNAHTAGLAGDRNSSDSNATAHDPGVTILDVQSIELNPLATVVHWPCHPTILGAENLLISADFPGALRRTLSRRTPSGVVLCLNGAAGDISTRFTRREQSASEVERYGRELAGAVIRATEQKTPLTPLLRHATTEITLRRWRDEEIIQHLYDNAVPSQDDRRAVTRSQGRAMLEALSASDCRPRRRTIRLDAWRIGEATVIAVPGELFSSLGATIEQAIDSPVVIAGYAGGYAGYLADCAAYRAGTYEALASALGPGCGERIAAAAAGLVVDLQ